MTKKFEVSFNSPQCGWMSIGFSYGENEFHTTTAHSPHERALPELMNILGDICSGAETQKEYLLKWNRDPEEFDFRFVKDNKKVLIEIYQYPTDDRDESEKELVYSHQGNIDEVHSAFAETFEQLYQDRETDEFELNWRQPFPFLEFEEFNKTAAN